MALFKTKAMPVVRNHIDHHILPDVGDDNPIIMRRTPEKIVENIGKPTREISDNHT